MATKFDPTHYYILPVGNVNCRIIEQGSFDALVETEGGSRIRIANSNLHALA